MSRIAIIGSGITGLTFAWLAKRAGRHVTLFESQPTLGMDAHSLDLSDKDGTVTDSGVNDHRVDVPPRMFNREDWPRLTQLYEQIGVETQVVDASKSFSWEDRTSWLQLGSRYRGGFSAKSLLSTRVREVASETARLQAAVTSEFVEQLPVELTMSQFLNEENYSDRFVYDFLFPGLASTVLTCGYEALSNYPAKIALRSLLNQVDQSPLRRTTHGTKDVVNRLVESVDELCLSTKVIEVRETSGQVVLLCEDGHERQFDLLLVATQANSAARLLGVDPAFAVEREVLNSFQYEDVAVVVHRDESFLSKKQSHRACFNFVSKEDRSDAMCTIWLNRFYPEWTPGKNLYQTIRPVRMPDDDLTIASTMMQRPIVSQRSLVAVNELKELQTPGRRVWFAGSYASDSVPLLESGVASAFEAAQKSGIAIPSGFEKPVSVC